MRGRVAGTLLALALLAGCSSLAGPDEYRSARDLPPLALPEGAETRPIRPLFAIPPGPLPETWPEKFELPRPRPLEQVAEAVPGAPVAGASTEATRPVLTQDGNGYPLASMTGDFNAIWDRLGEALRAAGVRIDDRDQRVSLYYLRLDDETGKDVSYQLRLARAQAAWTLTLQKDDETLAPRETSQSLFERITQHWPEDSRQPAPAGPRS